MAHRTLEPHPTGSRPNQSDQPTRWDATDYHQHSSAQTGWGREVHDRISLRGDEHIVDLGCGDGRLTAELGRRLPRGSATGIDSDASMIGFARSHHAGSNVTYVQADVRHFSLGRRVDGFVSTACLHWVDDPEAVLRCCREHLEPGGRLSFQMGGRGNCAELLNAVESVADDPRWTRYLRPLAPPWRFLGPESYERLLPLCGFRPLRVELVPKDMVHDGPEGLRAWLRTTWMPILNRAPEAERPDLLEAIVTRHLSQHPLDALGRSHTAMVRLEVEAVAAEHHG